MARLFHRQYARPFWNPKVLEGPIPGLSLREWEVSVILCSQPPLVKQALRAWLIAPTDPRWPRPERFSRHLLPFTASDLRDPAQPLSTRLFAEVQAMRQTLDQPLESLHGIARDLRLVAHGTRLRQIIGALGEPAALCEIEGLLRLAEQQPDPFLAMLRTRWGGRWAAFFSGAGG